VPSVINNKILRLHKKLNLLIDVIVQSSSYTGSGTGGGNQRHDEFSSTDYFFVSTNLARRLLHIPESAIVLAYTDQHPTIMQIDSSKDTDSNENLNSNHHHDDEISILRRVFVTLGILTSLLSQGLTIVLLGMGQLPETAQV